MNDFSHLAPLVEPERVRSHLHRLRQPVAITGGTGFMGSHLVETLCAAGISPRVLVRDPSAPRWISAAPVEWVPGALHRPEALGTLVEGAGTVIHLAGVLRSGRQQDFDSGNRAGTAALVRAIAAHAPSAQLIHVSSLAAVGPSPTPEGMDPRCDPAPISWYGRSKLAAERELSKLPASASWCVLRPPAIYGPRDTDILQFFRMAGTGVVTLPAGERWLTVAWVGDVVRSIIGAAGAACGSTFHLGEHSPLRIDQLVERLCEAGGVRAKVIRVPGAVVTLAGALGSGLHHLGFRRLAMTSDKSRELLARHWTARTADSMAALGIDEPVRFAEGAAVTWRWYRARGWLP